VKPNAISGYVLALAFLGWPDGRRSVRYRVGVVLLSCFGAIIPLAVFTAVFHRAGALKALMECYFVFNSVFGKNNLAYHGVSTLVFHGIENLFTLGLLPVVLACVLAGFLLRSPASGPLWLIAAWLLLEIGVMVSNGGSAYHAVPVLAPAVLMGTWLILRAFSSKRYRGVAVFSAIAVLFVSPLLRTAEAYRMPFELEQNPGVSRIVRDLEETTRPDEAVLAFPRPSGILIAVPRRSAAEPYFSFRPLFVKGYTSSSRWRELLDRLDRTPPRVVVLETYGWKGTRDLAPMVEWTLNAFDSDMPEQRDRAIVPNWKSLASFIASRYHIDYCADRFCLLRLGTNAQEVVGTNVFGGHTN
jgi:hypothetical protein